MNKTINFGNLSEVDTPHLIKLPVDHILRHEQCPVCKVSLTETFKTESSMPKDIMKVQIGRKYPSWLVSDSIFCPNCKMVFKHSTSDSELLARYKSIAKTGGVYKLSLSQDFLISRFDTSFEKNLKKGDIVYATTTSVNFSQEKPRLAKTLSGSSFPEHSYDTNFLYELKKGYKKSEGWSKGAIPIRQFNAWEQTSAVGVVMDILDLFTSSSRIKIPTRILVLPQEILKENN